jgi:hypothetical protein
MDLPTGFVRTWALDIANSCWIPSKRTDWEIWATVLANCQILKLSWFYVPCHVVICFSLSSIIFPHFPCFLIFLKGVFSPHLGLTPQTFQWHLLEVICEVCINNLDSKLEAITKLRAQTMSGWLLIHAYPLPPTSTTAQLPTPAPANAPQSIAQCESEKSNAQIYFPAKGM